MQDELSELLETAMHQEIVSQAFYTAGQQKTDDPSARALMRELAEEESRHLEMLKELKEQGAQEGQWHRERIPDLKISEYLIGGDTLEGSASLQDTLIFAMKRE